MYRRIFWLLLLLSASDPYARDNIQQKNYYLRDNDESLDNGSTYSFASSQSTLVGNQAQTPSGHAGHYYHPSSNAQPNYPSPQLINMNHFGRFSTDSSLSSPSVSDASGRNRSHGYFPEYPRSVYIPLILVLDLMAKVRVAVRASATFLEDVQISPSLGHLYIKPKPLSCRVVLRSGKNEYTFLTKSTVQLKYVSGASQLTCPTAVTLTTHRECGWGFIYDSILIDFFCLSKLCQLPGSKTELASWISAKFSKTEWQAHSSQSKIEKPEWDRLQKQPQG